MALTEEKPRLRFHERRWVLGFIAGLVWFFVFSAGILLDSESHRQALGWKSKEAQADEAFLVLGRRLANEGSPGNANGEPIETPGSGQTEKMDLLFDLIQKGSETQAPLKPELNRYQKFEHFLWSMLLFTPTNVALLTLLAAFVGGCASNEADTTLLQEQLRNAHNRRDHIEVRRIQQKLTFMREHPVFSLMRGLVIYLIFVSGLFIVAAEPFSAHEQATEMAQYIRLAGLLSLLGFMVGYDPSRFIDWLALIPSPSGVDPAERSGDNNTPTISDLGSANVVAAIVAEQEIEKIKDNSEEIVKMAEGQEIEKKAKKAKDGGF